MSLPLDLLHQARDLAGKERNKPKQASLRRSVSTSYYAVFHLFIEEGTAHLAGGTGKESLRQHLGRAYQHTAMKEAAKGFAYGAAASWVIDAMTNHSPGKSPYSPSRELQQVANAFVKLQEARHEADYNLGIRFTRRECLQLWATADDAFQKWRTVRKSPEAEVFLLALLLHRQIRN